MSAGDFPHITARTLALVDDLCGRPAETSWLEFKENNTDPQMIGRLISALSNAARLADQHFAYVLWGVRDSDRVATGTTFEPSSQTEQAQPLEFWLAQRLQPSIAFAFKTIDYRGTRIVMLEIPAAATSPVEFDRTAYIRVGSATPRLSDHPERLKALWARLQPYVWESGVAAQFLTSDEVLSRLDYASYFTLTRQPLPDNRAGIFDKLLADRLVVQDVGGHWNITNLGAVLFAKRLSDFSPSIAPKRCPFCRL
jgi:predicted HTH transcriptional regulator